MTNIRPISVNTQGINAQAGFGAQAKTDLKKQEEKKAPPQEQKAQLPPGDVLKIMDQMSAVNAATIKTGKGVELIRPEDKRPPKITALPHAVLSQSPAVGTGTPGAVVPPQVDLRPRPTSATPSIETPFPRVDLATNQVEVGFQILDPPVDSANAHDNKRKEIELIKIVRE